jgi:hypothetical protein
VSFTLGIIHFNLWGLFHASDAIEFFIDAREVNSQNDLNILLDFISYVGLILDKLVLIKTGDEPNMSPIITYNPVERTFQYHPP